MNNTLPHLAIIDDSLSFLKQINNTDLRALFTTQTFYIDQQTSLESLLEELRQFYPEYLVLDLNLNQTGKTQFILKALSEDNILCNINIWIISQAAQQEQQTIIEDFQTINANVQDRILPKPISPQFLWAELTDDSFFEPVPPWIDFKMPLRVLSHKGKVLYNNQHWSNRNEPKPDVFLTNKGEIKKEKIDFTGSFDNGNSSAYTVYSFELEDHSNHSSIMQLAYEHPLESVAVNLDDVLEKIFTAMRQSGYYHGRFYRIRELSEDKHHDEYNQILELTHISYNVPKLKDTPLPWSYFPLKNTLKERLEEHKERRYSKNKLAYIIRPCKEDIDAKDSKIDQLNKDLGLEDITSWLEIPIWMNQEYFPDEKNKDKTESKIVGWLFFDKIKPDDMETTEGGITDLDITDKNLLPVIPLLRSLVDMLVYSLWKEHLEDIWVYEKSMRTLDEVLLNAKDTNERFQYILDYLCKLGEAESGVLVLDDQDEKNLCVIAQSQNKNAPLLEHIRLPMDAIYHPIVKAWGEKKNNTYQDFSKSALYNQVCEFNSNDNIPEYLKDIDWDDFYTWVKEGIGSLFAIAITLPGDHVIGGITLQYKDKYQITSCREIKINAILQRARWVIQQCYKEREFQETWRIAAAHEIKSYLYTAMQNIEELLRCDPDLINNEKFKEALLWSEAAKDQAETLLDYERIESIDKVYKKQSILTFSPADVIDKFLLLSSEIQQDDNIDIKKIPENTQDNKWQIILEGNKEIFSRIVREILFNAFKYGFYYADNQSVEIVIKTDINNDFWHLSVTNPGCLDSDNTQESKPAGARIGLKIAIKLADSCGGQLTVEEKKKSNKVTASLYWPIINIKDIKYESS